MRRLTKLSLRIMITLSEIYLHIIISFLIINSPGSYESFQRNQQLNLLKANLKQAEVEMATQFGKHKTQFYKM